MIILLICSYLIGSIPFGVMFAKMFKLGDLRSFGSGNIGATNMARVGGKKIAALTLFFDMLKGMLPAMLGFLAVGPQLAAMCAGMAVIGHVFPVWLKFKGGKGVATYIGGLIAVNIMVAGIFASVWILSFLIKKTSAFSAMLALVASTCAVIYFSTSITVKIIFVALFCLLVFTHRENIRRMFKGKELKF